MAHVIPGTSSTTSIWVVLSVRQVTLQGMTVANVNSAGLDQTVTRGKSLWYGRTSSPWPLKSSRSSSMFWNWLRPPPTQTMWLPLSTGWDSWDQMELSPRLPTSQSTTSLSGNITTLSETLSLVNEHGYIYFLNSQFKDRHGLSSIIIFFPSRSWSSIQSHWFLTQRTSIHHLAPVSPPQLRTRATGMCHFLKTCY